MAIAYDHVEIYNFVISASSRQSFNIRIGKFREPQLIWQPMAVSGDKHERAAVTMERTWTEELKRDQLSIKSMVRRIDGQLYRTIQSTVVAADPYTKLILYRNTLDPEFDFEEWQPAQFLCRGRNGSYFVQRQFLDESGNDNVIDPLSLDDAVNLFDRLPKQSLEFEEAFPGLVDDPTNGDNSRSDAPIWETQIAISERRPENRARQVQVDQKNFFISYNKANGDWAEWIAWQLEASGQTTTLQAWDFQPGMNFPLKMSEAIDRSSHTIALLSQDYVSSAFAESEWAAAFASDSSGSQRRLIPVRIEPCDIPGLLASIVYIDLVGRGEVDAKRELLKGISENRAKPTEPPPFPGTRTSINREEPHFPAVISTGQATANDASRCLSATAGEAMLSQIFQFTTGDYVVVELENGLRFRLTGLQRAANATALRFQLQDARVIYSAIDTTTPFSGQELPKIRSTTFNSDSGTYEVVTENEDRFNLTPDEAATMLRPDQL